MTIFSKRALSLAFVCLGLSFLRTASAQNLVVNGDFAQAQMLAAWNPDPGVAWSSTPDHTGVAMSGSAKFVLAANDTQTMFQCVPVMPGTTYMFTAYSNISSSTLGVLGGNLNLYASSNCTGPSTTLFVLFDQTADSAWHAVNLMTTSAGSVSITIIANTPTMPAGANLTAALDDVSLSCVGVDGTGPTVTAPPAATAPQTLCQ